MLSDFKDMTNHLLAYALHNRITDAFKLRDSQYDWFHKNYNGRYAVHYLHSASSYAMGIAKSWREVGKSRLPHLKRPVARLDQELVKCESIGDYGLRFRITLAPRKFAYVEIPFIHHKKFKAWSQYKIGEITIHGYHSVDLPFHVPDDKLDSVQMAAFDMNFEHVDIAFSDGRLQKIDISKITQIQARMKKKRDSIQKSIPNNLAKQQKVLNKYHRREHNRVKQVLEDKGKEIAKATNGCVLLMEDLKDTTKDCLKKSKKKKPKSSKGKKKQKVFNDKLSKWVHSGLQDTIEKNATCRTKKPSAKGTSTYCPFCTMDNKRTKLTHPKYHISQCSNHGIFDRHLLSSIAILERGRRYLRRAPFPPSVASSHLKGSVLGNEGASIAIGSRARLENHNDPVKDEDLNVEKLPEWTLIKDVYSCQSR